MCIEAHNIIFFRRNILKNIQHILFEIPQKHQAVFFTNLHICRLGSDRLWAFMQNELSNSTPKNFFKIRNTLNFIYKKVIPNFDDL